MSKFSSYCDYVKILEKENIHVIYHDSQRGFAINSDDELFGRLLLEINQAGLSWNTILNKQKNFREAYSNFSIEKVANYSEKDRTRQLNNTGNSKKKIKNRCCNL